MEQFKRSVLDERGRVRPMTDRKAAEVAGAAADGILKLVSCCLISLVPLSVDISSVAFSVSSIHFVKTYFQRLAFCWLPLLFVRWIFG